MARQLELNSSSIFGNQQQATVRKDPHEVANDRESKRESEKATGKKGAEFYRKTENV